MTQVKNKNSWDQKAFFDFCKLYLKILYHSAESIDQAVNQNDKDKIKNNSLMIRNATEQLKNIFDAYKIQIRGYDDEE